MTRRRIAWGTGLLAAVGGAYLLAWPVPFDPARWEPPPERAAGPVAPLEAVERLGRELPGPEAVAIDSAGRVHTGLQDGRIVRLAADGSAEVVANTGGRPLGMKFRKDGRLVVADAVKGLLELDAGGAVRVLATEHGGVPFLFTDDLDIGADGVIYFSDASHRFGVHHYREDALEHRPNGRLLAHHPDGRTELLKDGLYFANGVALARDESFVLVTETWKYRVTRVWLSPGRRAASDVFIDALPGFPDNITRAPDGERFWLALFAPRNAQIDGMAGRPLLRKVVARLPAFLQPAPARHAFVLELDAAGAILRSLQDPKPDSYSPITSALEHDGKLYLGSLWRQEIGLFVPR